MAAAGWPLAEDTKPGGPCKCDFGRLTVDGCEPPPHGMTAGARRDLAPFWGD